MSSSGSQSNGLISSVVGSVVGDSIGGSAGVAAGEKNVGTFEMLGNAVIPGDSLGSPEGEVEETVGDLEGDAVTARAVGCAVGVTVSELSVGFIVGVTEDTDCGELVGVSSGISVGEAVGLEDGKGTVEAVGRAAGNVLGRLLGEFEGTMLVGENEREALGFVLVLSLGRSLGASDSWQSRLQSSRLFNSSAQRRASS